MHKKKRPHNPRKPTSRHVRLSLTAKLPAIRTRVRTDRVELDRKDHRGAAVSQRSLWTCSKVRVFRFSPSSW